MGKNGNSIDRNQAGKFFAVLWILAAAIAMQFVASAQGFSSRFSTQQSAGPFLRPAPVFVAAVSYGSMPIAAFSDAVITGAPGDIARARGPPALNA
jgi:hypothetical protein